MGISIDNIIKELLINKEDDTYVLGNETIDFAVYTMRKYQLMQADYEARLKADLAAMLTEIQLEIEELDPFGDEWSDSLDACSDIIQQKINALKGEQGENTN